MLFRSKGVDKDWKVELFEVPASALLEELQYIFDGFYPDGIPLSKVEKKEVCELFREWIEVQKSLRASDGMCSDSQMIPFKEFHGWFYDLSEMIHNAMSDRLLTYILLLTHRSNAVSADAVQLLNTVAPKHSNAIYKTYISIRPYSVVAPSLKTIYTENPFFHSHLISRHSHDLSGQDSRRDIDRHIDGNDLNSTHTQNSFEESLFDSIYPVHSLPGSLRNITQAEKIHDSTNSNDLCCMYPEGVSMENASPSAHPHCSLKGNPHNIRELRDPLRMTPLKSIYPHTPH